jgi:hypothetical protein
MAEVLDVTNAFSLSLKVAWIVWLAWGIGQVFWYRFERASAVAPNLSSGVRVPRRTAAPHTARPVVMPSAPATSRLITPTSIKAAQAPPPAAPVFDPSKAIVETFDARDHSLDEIVADMERHLPPTRGEAA